jgi:long-chain acyl-CoA synthetase
MFGREVVPRLLEKSDADLVLMVHEAGVGESAKYLLSNYFSVPSSVGCGRLRIVRGDITREYLGLRPRERDRLCQSVTHILHAAATTRFDLPLDEAMRVNLCGTENMAMLAGKCSRLEAFGYVSTAYVAGRRRGLILETDLEHDAGFVNTYERSKYEAEGFLVTLAARLPIVRYRLSSVVGNSRTGEVLNFTAPHHAMRMMHLGLASMVPGTADYQVDMIPGDIAADAIVELFLHRFHAGDVFHVVAGPAKSYTLDEVIDEIYATFAEHDPEWERRRYPKPVLAPASAFDLFIESVEQAGNPFLLAVLKAVRHFSDQLTYPKTFDVTNLLQRLPEYAVQLPGIDTYYRKIIRYCLQTNWGKQDAA